MSGTHFVPAPYLRILPGFPTTEIISREEAVEKDNPHLAWKGKGLLNWSVKSWTDKGSDITGDSDKLAPQHFTVPPPPRSRPA